MMRVGGMAGAGAMIFKRVSAGLRAQNWMAVLIEFAIVVAGVFVGTQVSNWNAERLARMETQRMLDQFKPELRNQLVSHAISRRYYATTRRFADQAFAGWRRDPAVSDAQFVIAAYQASQITGIGLNGDAWSLTFGGDQIRNIDDPKVRRLLEIILVADYSTVDVATVSTAYREQVRHVIPSGMQDAIRRVCGDKVSQLEGGFILVSLPRTCPLRIAPDEAATVAAALRERRDLPGELNWHLAAIANYKQNFDGLVEPMRDLLRALESSPSQRSG